MDDKIMREIIIENERLRTEAVQLQAQAVASAVAKMTEVYLADREREMVKPAPPSESKKIRDEAWFVGHMVQIAYENTPGGFSADHEMTKQWARWMRLLERERELSEAEFGL